jgi:AcrR family transcriptional regulator
MDARPPDRTTADAGRRRRADAERNIAAILDATVQCAPSDGTLNMSAIARLAGVSRVTLYTHFPTREALMGAALQRAFRQTDEVLSGLPLDDAPPAEVLPELIRTSWQILERHRNLYMAASADLPPATLRAYAELVLGRVEKLLSRGQSAGVFRTDMPLDWLVSTVYTLMHLAAEQVATAHTPPDVAGDLASTTIMSLLTSGTPAAPGA